MTKYEWMYDGMYELSHILPKIENVLVVVTVRSGYDVSRVRLAPCS